MTVPQNYPGNSQVGKDREKRQEPEEEPVSKATKIVTGEVLQRKKPLGRRIAESFTGDDMKTVGGFVLFDVIIPAAKEMLYDALMQGVSRRLFSDARPTRFGNGGTRSTSLRTNYNKISTTGSGSAWKPNAPTSDMSYKARANYDFSELVIDDRGEAEAILEQLGTFIREYEVATVADFLTMCGKSASFTERKWGWDDIRGASVRRVTGGFIIDLPRPIPLD